MILTFQIKCNIGRLARTTVCVCLAAIVCLAPVPAAHAYTDQDPSVAAGGISPSPAPAVAPDDPEKRQHDVSSNRFFGKSPWWYGALLLFLIFLVPLAFLALRRTRLVDKPTELTPGWLMAGIILSIYLAELVVMFVIGVLPSIPEPFEAFLDSTLLVIILFPPLYVLIINPLIQRIRERNEYAAILSESEERYRALFRFNPDSVTLLSTSGRFINANPVASSMTGYSLEELKVMNFQDLVMPGELETAEAVFKRTVEGLPQTHIIPIRTKGGRMLEVDSKTIPVFVKNEVIGIFCIGKDVTEERRKEAALRKTQRIIEAAGEAIFMTDPDGTIIYANPAFQLLTGYRPEETVGKNPEFLKSGRHGRDFFRDMWNTILQGGIWKGEIINKRKDGSYYDTYSVIAPVLKKDGSLEGFVSLQHDISELKKREQELHAAREKAENATRLKDKFVSLVSHDLRNPLQTILGYLKLIKETYGPEIPARPRVYINHAITSGEHMTKLIEELLSISRIKVGKIQPQMRYFNAYQTVEKVLQDLRLKADDKGVLLYNQVPEGTRVFGDPVLLGEVFGNLLSNAIKFTHRGDTVNISQPDRSIPVFTVKDSGVGIQPEDLEQLFDYETKTSREGTAGEVGTGLGLPFSQDILKAHGGELKVESTPGKGTLFTLALPDARPTILAMAPTSSQKGIKMALRNIRCHQAVVESHDEAIKFCQDQDPHLILCQTKKGDKVCFELLNMVRRNGSRRTPFLIIIPDDDRATKEDALTYGATEIINESEMDSGLQNLVEKNLG